MDGAPLSTESPQLKSKAVIGRSEINLQAHQCIAIPEHVQNKGQQSSPKVGLQATNVVKDVKTESNGTRVFDQANKPAAKEKVPPVPMNIERNSRMRKALLLLEVHWQISGAGHL